MDQWKFVTIPFCQEKSSHSNVNDNQFAITESLQYTAQLFLLT